MARSETTPTLTIVLPAYIPAGPRSAESANYLRRAVASLKVQDDHRWSCVVYDNSPDPSSVAAILAEHGDGRLEHRPNPVDIGLLGSMNRGLDEATTDLVGFLHGDDELCPGYVAAIMELDRRNPNASGFLGGVEVIDGAGAPISPWADRIKAALSPARRREAIVAGDAGAARLMFGMWAYSPALVVRRDRLHGLRFDETNLYAGDTEFVVDIVARGGSLIATPQPLYRYRRHGVSGTVIMTKDGTRARLEHEFFTRKTVELEALGLRRAALAARIRPFSRAASLGRLGRAAAARTYK